MRRVLETVSLGNDLTNGNKKSCCCFHILGLENCDVLMTSKAIFFFMLLGRAECFKPSVKANLANDSHEYKISLDFDRLSCHGFSNLQYGFTFGIGNGTECDEKDRDSIGWVTIRTSFQA